MDYIFIQEAYLVCLMMSGPLAVARLCTLSSADRKPFQNRTTTGEPSCFLSFSVSKIIPNGTSHYTHDSISLRTYRILRASKVWPETISINRQLIRTGTFDIPQVELLASRKVGPPTQNVPRNDMALLTDFLLLPLSREPHPRTSLSSTRPSPPQSKEISKVV